MYAKNDNLNPFKSHTPRKKYHASMEQLPNVTRKDPHVRTNLETKHVIFKLLQPCSHFLFGHAVLAVHCIFEINVQD